MFFNFQTETRNVIIEADHQQAARERAKVLNIMTFKEYLAGFEEPVVTEENDKKTVILYQDGGVEIS